MSDSLDRQYECLCWFEQHCPTDLDADRRHLALCVALRDVRVHESWTPVECVTSAVRVMREVAS